MQRHSFTALNSTFVVDSEYQFVKELGQGAYGCVVAAKHRRTGEGCAIKKITNINTKVCSIILCYMRRACCGLGPGRCPFSVLPAFVAADADDEGPKGEIKSSELLWPNTPGRWPGCGCYEKRRRR